MTVRNAFAYVYSFVFLQSIIFLNEHDLFVNLSLCQLSFSHVFYDSNFLAQN